ncbi:vesicular glutamate transporter 2-like isoform X2 [Planococcus citri]|uniref:vesicular glutamate transporter 2-like isoform X2 n=1 Tax=Planococcus citri TaxID=170843 RepID=UPI0031F882AA
MKAAKNNEDDNYTSWLLDPRKENISDDFDRSNPPSIWFSKRLFVTVMLFMCFLSSAMVRSNVNIAVVDMTSNKSIVRDGLNITIPPEFDWDSTTIGVIFSIFSYGALLSFLGAFPVAAFGPSTSCSVSIMIMGVTTLLHSASLYANFYLFLICRFISGLAEAFFNVSTAEIFTRWIPQSERSTLVSFSFNGANVGFAIAYPVLGFLAYNFGWQTIFYFTGIIPMVLSVILLMFVKNRPCQDVWISKQELQYISRETNMYLPRHMVIHPYRMIFTSAAVWALLVGKFIHGWITSVLNVYFPIYVEDLTHTTTDEVGLISSIPTVVYIFMFPIAGTMMDYWKTHSHLTMTQIHKIIMSFTLITAGILFVAIAIISNFTVSMVMFVIIQILMSFVILILELVTVNLAPNDTSIIAGLSTFSAAFSSIISRTIIGFIITEHTLHEWNDCFILTAFVLISGAVIFVKYGSSEAQPWSLEVFSDAGYSSFDSQETRKDFR